MPESGDSELAQEALEALSRAHAPYSRFPVGAALRARSGRTYRGVNIENASLGLSICAERVAVFTAVAAGEKEFDAIAIVTRASSPTPPCGACRQVLLEFAGDDLPVVLATTTQTAATERHTLGELVPVPFRRFEPGA